MTVGHAGGRSAGGFGYEAIGGRYGGAGSFAEASDCAEAGVRPEHGGGWATADDAGGATTWDPQH